MVEECDNKRTFPTMAMPDEEGEEVPFGPTGIFRLTETNDIHFFSAAKQVLESHITRNWIISLAVLVAIIVWPIAMFWNAVRFDPAKFVEEWIKLSVEGLLIFLLLEIMRHRSLAVAAKTGIDRLLSTYIASAEEIKIALQQTQHAIDEDHVESVGELLQAVAASWRTLAHGLSDEFIHSLPEHLRTRLLAVRLKLKPQRFESLLKSLRVAHSVEEYNRSELQELLERSDRMIRGLLQLRDGEKELTA